MRWRRKNQGMGVSAKKGGCPYDFPKEGRGGRLIMTDGISQRKVELNVKENKRSWN